jgi:GH24 family phage-related lysozyme (muramidase)
VRCPLRPGYRPLCRGRGPRAGRCTRHANQFDALVSFHYNTGAIATATLTKKHITGDHAGAAHEFGKWIYNDGKPMNGLKARRAEEAALYVRA